MDSLQETQKNIQENYDRVLNRIRITAEKAGRDVNNIRLVVVTKTQPIEVIRWVIEAGATHLGENYVEEAIPKIETLSSYDNLNWHMIGHLQGRKVQKFYKYFNFLHSLDSLKLANKINNIAADENKKIPVWLEFNIGGEVSKSGWNISDENDWNEILPEIDQIIKMPKLDVLGVMTVPPVSVSAEASRPYFQRLRKFQEYIIAQLHPANFTELSIGMSSDFEIAIQEGSTCLRIGQAILGSRTK